MSLRARLVSGAHHGIISAVAGIIAYVPTRALGLNEGFWSAITAIGQFRRRDVPFPRDRGWMGCVGGGFGRVAGGAAAGASIASM